MTTLVLLTCTGALIESCTKTTARSGAPPAVFGAKKFSGETLKIGFKASGSSRGDPAATAALETQKTTPTLAIAPAAMMVAKIPKSSATTNGIQNGTQKFAQIAAMTAHMKSVRTTAPTASATSRFALG
jgi:hypothetical protein